MDKCRCRGRTQWRGGSEYRWDQEDREAAQVSDRCELQMVPQHSQLALRTTNQP